MSPQPKNTVPNTGPSSHPQTGREQLPKNKRPKKHHQYWTKHSFLFLRFVKPNNHYYYDRQQKYYYAAPKK